MSTNYLAFGLTVASEIDLPLPTTNNESIDVCVEIDATPQNLQNPIRVGHDFELSENELLVHIKNLASIWIRNGTTITIQLKNPDREFRDLGLYVLGSGLGSILEQRGACCLHASSVVRDGCCHLFIGNSGTGKSTISAALTSSGFEHFSDDVCPLQLKNNVLFAKSGYPTSKLWPDSLAQLNIAGDELPVVRSDISKKRLSWSDQGANHESPVASIFALCPMPEGEIAVNRVSPADAFKICRGHRYRPHWQLTAERHKRLFKILTHIANRIPTHIAIRSKTVFELDAFRNEIVRCIEQTQSPILRLD